MSVPSSSSPHRSSSVASTTSTEPYDDLIKEFFKPDGLLIDFIKHSDTAMMLDSLGFACADAPLPHYGVDQYVDKEVMKQLKKTAGREKFPAAKEAFKLAFLRAILDTGRLNPIIAKHLRKHVESRDPFYEKSGYISSVGHNYHLCNCSMKEALKLPIAERIETIIELIEVDSHSSRLQSLCDRLDLYGYELTSSSMNTAPEATGTYRQLLAIRIAGTISEDFAWRLGEEFAAESRIGKIKSFIENEKDALLKQSPQGPTPSWSSSSHLTTTTNTTPLTTTTTSTVPTTTTTSTVPTTATAPITTTTTITAPSAISARANNSSSAMAANPLASKSGEDILVAFGYPLSLQKQHSKKWKEAAKLVQKFYKECAPQPGSNRERLMRTYTGSLKDSVDSLAVVSVLGLKEEELADRLAFEKNIAPNTDAALNKAIVGRSQGYAQRHPELLSGRSPVSTCATVAMIRPDGAIVTPKVACISSPALGKNGAELSAYMKPDGHLDRALYLKARQSISNQVIENVMSAGSSRRVILSAAGMGEFIAGLSREDAAEATKIAVKEMATLVDQLTAEGVSVAYTDRDDQGSFWKQVNTQVKTPLGFVGAMPGNWVDDNDLVINSTSNFYYPGHGGIAAKSLDGQFGDTLLFDAHVLRSIFHSVGLKPEDLG